MYLIMSSLPKGSDIDFVENLWWRMMTNREVANHSWSKDTEDDVYKSLKHWKKAAWNMAFKVLIGGDKFPRIWKKILEERAHYSE
jgi:hypothetical protein